MARKVTLKARVKALGYRDYFAYLNSDHWLDVRRRYRASKLVRKNKAGKITCAYCDCTERLELHHKHYKRLGKEHLKDLILLCHDHHQLIHSK